MLAALNERGGIGERKHAHRVLRLRRRVHVDAAAGQHAPVAVPPGRDTRRVVVEEQGDLQQALQMDRGPGQAPLHPHRHGGSLRGQPARRRLELALQGAAALGQQGLRAVDGAVFAGACHTVGDALRREGMAGSSRSAPDGVARERAILKNVDWASVLAGQGDASAPADAGPPVWLQLTRGLRFGSS